MGCLSDAEIQTVVDGEASESVRAHAEQCALCARRVDARRGEMAAFLAFIKSDEPVPSRLDDAVRRVVADQGRVRGATALRGRPPTWHVRAWTSALASAAVVAAVIFLVLPRLGAPTKLSAAEILGRSLQTLTATRGIERIEYELSVNGFLDGVHHIQQIVDHDRPNRFKLANFGPDGTLESALSQDPLVGRRTQLIRVDGRNFVINVNASQHPIPSIPDMIQAQLEAAITMMQATTNQNLTVTDAGPLGKQYVIQIPAASVKGGGLFDIDQARVVVAGPDFLIYELEASGTALKQPFSLSFRLIRRDVRVAAGAPSDEFTIKPGAADVVLEAQGSGDPLGDVLVTVLRELARAKGY